jgi:hypothetical protein
MRLKGSCEKPLIEERNRNPDRDSVAVRSTVWESLPLQGGGRMSNSIPWHENGYPTQVFAGALGIAKK